MTINQAAGQADPTSASPINFTVTFSETVTGFTAGDISFAGSTAGGTLTAAVTGTGPTYNVAVSGMTGTGNVVMSVPAGAATDAAGNASLVSTSTDNTVAFTIIDTIAPAVQSINRVGTTPTNAASVSWTVLFSESVTGVDASDFALATTGGDWRDDHDRERQREPVHGDGEHRDGQWDAGPEPGGQRYHPRSQRQSIGRHGLGQRQLHGPELHDR